ncbi:contractile injection system protein, VgrG/Pvc8 family [Sorangium sp. So ce375]|uniref:phage late control D family protein n=1 Tax=Sorangium sp. So ce375 TaxID=3133306 RepID=UPI003F5BF19E
MESGSDVPSIEVRLDGKPWPAPYWDALVDVDVQDDTEGPSACKISFIAWDDEKTDVSRVDDKLFDMGKAIEIDLGYTSNLETVCKAEIVSVELDLSSGQAPRFTVRGYDRRHRLRRGTSTRTFVDMKDSDIAAQIANKNGLSPKVKDSGVVRKYVLQDGKSDLEFLRERAKEIDYEVVVDGEVLLFQKKSTTQKTVVLSADKDLNDFSATVKAADQVGSVEVRGWDPATKKEIIGTSGSASAAPPGASGDAAFGKAKLVLTRQAIATQEEADRAAYAELERLARRSMSVQGSCLGRTDLRAGVEVDIQNVGARFSGKYRLGSVTHRFSAKSGFQTSFSAEKQLP